MSDEKKEKSDLDVVDKKEETKEKPLWKEILDEFRPKEEPTSEIGKIGANIKTVWNIAVALVVLILIIMAFTGKFDQLAYDMGIAGKPDSASHDYVMTDSNGNKYDIAVDKKGNPMIDEDGNYILEDYELAKLQGNDENSAGPINTSAQKNDIVYGTEEERKFLEDFGFNLDKIQFQTKGHFMYIYEAAKAIYNDDDENVSIKNMDDLRDYVTNNNFSMFTSDLSYNQSLNDDFVISYALGGVGFAEDDVKRNLGDSYDTIYWETAHCVANPIVTTTVEKNYSSENQVTDLEYVNYGYDIDTNDMYTMDDISTIVSNAREEYRNGIQPLYLSNDIYLDINDYGNYGQYIGKLFLLEGTIDTYSVDDRTGFMMWLNLPLIIADGGYNGAFLNTTVIDSSNLEGDDGMNISVPAVFVGRDYYGTPYFVALD